MSRLSGFTLIELLIVFTLIVSMSVAIISIINPIEQSNKARDMKYENDATELMNALNRYYVAEDQYPWSVIKYKTSSTVDKLIASNIRAGFSSRDRRLGVVKTDDTDGVLMDTFETKSSFSNKTQFRSGIDEKERMYVYTDGKFNVFVCFCPKAAINKIKENVDNLKCLFGYNSNPTSEESTAKNVYLFDVGDNISDVVGGAGEVNCISPESGVVNSSDFCKPGLSLSGVGGVAYIANMKCVPKESIKSEEND